MSELVRPTPLPWPADAIRIDGNARYREVEEWLTQGRPVCITDTYGTALTLYGWLKRSVLRRRPVTDWRTQRLYRQLLRQLTRTLLVPVADHLLLLKNAPPIPWLQLLYPDADEFLLPLPDVLGLNGSWQWYSRGVRYRVLDQLLHPFYGVWFTTRGEHLELADAYLTQRGAGPLAALSALDAGTMAGSLTMLLLKRGVGRLEATDDNPNAIRSVNDDLVRAGVRGRVELRRGELVPEGPPVDLIMHFAPAAAGAAGPAAGEETVVEPPGDVQAARSAAALAAAGRRLTPAGRLVVLASNLHELVGEPAVCPLAAALETQERFRVINRMERPLGGAVRPRDPQWLQQLRARERAQLWELEPR